MTSELILDSVITCPTYGHSRLETMPTNFRSRGEQEAHVAEPRRLPPKQIPTRNVELPS